MDKIDHRILTSLEDDARQSFAELGDQVGLSKTPCWQRVRELERSGVIRGYRAEIDSAQLGLKVEAFVHVTLSSVQHVEFEAAVLQHPAVLQCFTTAGQADYLMHVLVAGIGKAMAKDPNDRFPSCGELAARWPARSSTSITGARCHTLAPRRVRVSATRRSAA